jgi:hypothetical protein
MAAGRATPFAALILLYGCGGAGATSTGSAVDKQRCHPDFRTDDPFVAEYVTDVVNALAWNTRVDGSHGCDRPDPSKPFVLKQVTVNEPDGDRIEDEIHIDGNSLEGASLRWAPVSVERIDLLRTSLEEGATAPYVQALYIERVDAWIEHRRFIAREGRWVRWVQRTTSVVIPVDLSDDTALELYSAARVAAALDFAEPPPRGDVRDGIDWTIYPPAEAPSASASAPAPPSAPAPSAQVAFHKPPKRRTPGAVPNAPLFETPLAPSIMIAPRSTNQGVLP